LGTDVYGDLLALNGFMIVIFELPLTSITRRFSPPRGMAFGYLLVGAGMLANILGANLGILTLSMVIFTVGEMISLPVGQSYMASLAPEDMRGRYMGVLSVAWSSATMIGLAAGVALYQFNPPVLWVAVFMISLLAAGAVLSLSPHREKEGAAVPQPVADG
jgi:MFS family permease